MRRVKSTALSVRPPLHSELTFPSFADAVSFFGLNDRLLVNDLLMVHKCIHDLIPSYLTGEFIQRSKIHG